MAIQDLTNRKYGNLKAGNWRREVTKSFDTPDGGTVRGVTIFHYSTAMLKYAELADGSVRLLERNEGHGSVSDKQGVNKLLRALNCGDLVAA